MFKRRMDVNYVNYISSLNDATWRNDEKRLYYSYKNEDYIIPTFLICVVALFTNPPFVGVCWCILIVLGALFLCHLNNLELDKSQWILNKREFYRRYRRECMNMNV